jgi:hypothetical protein
MTKLNRTSPKTDLTRYCTHENKHKDTVALPNKKQTASPKARDCKCIHASPETTMKPCTAQRINKNNTDGPHQKQPYTLQHARNQGRILNYRTKSNQTLQRASTNKTESPHQKQL